MTIIKYPKTGFDCITILVFKFKYKIESVYIMDITADRIQRTCAGSQVLELHIKSILKTFQSEIIEAGKSGHTRVVISVPTNFDVVSMDNKTAQTVIYHRLISECEEKGFKVKVSMDKSSTTFCIRWDIKENEGDLHKMRDKIAAHMVNVSIKHKR